MLQQLQLLPPDVYDAVRVAFAESLQLVWQIMAGITGLGLIVSFLMRHHALHTTTDDDWGLKDKESKDNRNIRPELEA